MAEHTVVFEEARPTSLTIPDLARASWCPKKESWEVVLETVFGRLRFDVTEIGGDYINTALSDRQQYDAVSRILGILADGAAEERRAHHADSNLEGG